MFVVHLIDQYSAVSSSVVSNQRSISNHQHASSSLLLLQQEQQLLVDRSAYMVTNQVVAAAPDSSTSKNNNDSPVAHIKRPLNAFMLFSAHRRRQMAENNSTAMRTIRNNSELSKQLGVEWRMMSDDEKREFVDESNRIRQQHQRVRT